jgi:hypothetical protein
VGGGASLVVGFLNPASPWRFAVFGFAAVLFIAGIVVIGFGFRRPPPPTVPPPSIGIQQDSGIILGNAVTGYDIGIQVGTGMTIGNVVDETSASPPTKEPNWLVRLWHWLVGHS